jgi:hypothetical protein
MSTREKERDQQHMLHLVELAQRAGYSESEIDEMVEDAVEADAEREVAA